MNDTDKFEIENESSTGTQFVFVSVVRLGRNLRSNENETKSSTGTPFVFVFVSLLGLAL